MTEPLNLDELRSELQEHGSPWEMDVTSMTRLEEDDRRIRLGVTPPPGELSIEEAAAQFADGVTTAAEDAESVGAPAAYDLRNVGGKNFTTSVKNQGSCGSCVAFGSAAAMETTFKRGRNNPNQLIDVSEAHFFYCHARSEGRNCGNGWWPDNALKKARDIGVTFEQHYPYTPGDQNCTGLQSGWQNDLAKSRGHQKLSSTGAMKDWISTRGSLVACMIVYQDFFSYRSGVYRHVSGASAGGHCVEIVGYDDNAGCWICKNSWGTGWGEGGWFRIAYGQCGIDSWLGPYVVEGVTVRTWQRNVTVTGLWSNNVDRNAWAHVSGVGWRKLASDSDPVTQTMLAQVISAKAGNRPIHALEDADQIRELYVL